MKRRSILSTLIITLSAMLLLSGCGSKLGSSASPPGDLQVVGGDSSAKATWAMTPGVQYWLLFAPGDGITTGNWTSLPGASSVINAVSPQLIPGLINGQVYSFVMDARVNGGPAGSSTNTVSATPRLAGGSWSLGTSLGSMNLSSVTFGTVFVAVGSNGAIFSSTDGSVWTPQVNPSSSATLNAVRYGGSYVAAGAGGIVLLSSDAITWTQQISGTGNDLYALTSNGGQYVATGANGTIITSSNGSTWGAVTSGTTSNLYAVTYGNGRYVAVGANGSLLSSTDGLNWQSASSGTSANLYGVAFGSMLSPATATIVSAFVAVGASGTMVTSADGLNWSAQAPVTSNTLTAIDFGRQFVAVGNAGRLLTSTDGVAWLVQPQAPAANPTANNLNAVTHDLYGYIAVGAAGTNLSSF